MELYLTLPVFVLLRGLCSSFVRVVDGGPGADHLVDALRSHTGAGSMTATMASIRKDMTICMV